MVQNRKKLALLLVLLLLAGIAAAQDDTATDDTTADTDTGPQSSVQFFFVACETNAVFDLTGNMLAGFDVYVQVFQGLNTDGASLSNVFQVPVDGSYQVSPTVNYTNGQVLATGQFASATISIAREGNPGSPVYTGTIDDVQDGCATPAYGSTDTVDAGVGTGTGSTGTTITEDGTIIIGSADDVVTSGEGIFAPNGEVYFPPGEAPEPTPEPVVVIGAREAPRDERRSSNPGLIFAECNQYPDISAPGTIYPSDTVVTFWSWFASSRALAQQHIDNAIYDMRFNDARVGQTGLPGIVNRSEIVQRSDGNYWVFYTATLGNLSPGSYSVGYNVRWEQTISDGFEEFGPGTATPGISSNCDFIVSPN